MRLQTLVVTVIWLCGAAGALDLPSYITPCDFDDPDLDACALREARKVIKMVVNGDQKYHIPKLEPFLIQELKVDQDSAAQAIGFSFVAYNCTVWGMSGVNIKAIRISKKTHHNEYDLEFPRLEIKANYKASGKVLLLPITGTGSANITITDVKATYRYNFTVDRRPSGDFAVVTDNKLDYGIDGRVYVHLDNLFNGEEILNDNINAVLNDNWRDLVHDVGPTIAVAIGDLVKLVMAGILELVPLQNAFRDYPRP